MESHQIWSGFFSAVVLVLIRISGLMTFAPFFSSQAIPARGKAVFAIAVSVLLGPIVAGLPMSHAELGVLPALGELAVGLVFGLSLSLLNELLMFAGQVVGVQFSFSLVNLLDPNSQIQTPLLGQLFSIFGTMVLLAAGLHRTLLASVMRSFAEAPVGSVFLNERAGVALVGMAGGIFMAALQLAAPVLAATLLVEITIALLARLSPQLPALALTVPAKTMVGYVVLIGSIALWPRFIEMRFAGLLDSAEALIRHCVVRG
jgi:flagellar biosynthesis protein FliR